MMILLVKSNLYNELSDIYIEKSNHNKRVKANLVKKLVQIKDKHGSHEGYRWVKLLEEDKHKRESGSYELENMLTRYRNNLSPKVKEWVKGRYKGCKKKYYSITEPETGHIYKGYIYEHPNRSHGANEFKERLQAVILSSLGFKVYLIEEPSVGSKKVDAIVNGVPIDFKKSTNQKDKNEDSSIQNNYQKGMKKYNCEGVFVHVIENKPTQVSINRQKVFLPLDEAVHSMSKQGKNGFLSVWVETDQKFHTHDLKQIREAHKGTSPGGIKKSRTI